MHIKQIQLKTGRSHNIDHEHILITLSTYRGFRFHPRALPSTESYCKLYWIGSEQLVILTFSKNGNDLAVQNLPLMRHKPFMNHSLTMKKDVYKIID